VDDFDRVTVSKAIVSLPNDAQLTFFSYLNGRHFFHVASQWMMYFQFNLLMYSSILAFQRASVLAFRRGRSVEACVPGTGRGRQLDSKVTYGAA
jgi:hypothetical protein